MSDHDRISRALAASYKRYGQQIAKDWRYVHFFNFLQVSPSYALAEAIARNRLSLDRTQLPADFPRVQKTYEAFGPVHRNYFWNWWVNQAQYRFGLTVDAKPKALGFYARRSAIDPAAIDKTRRSLNDWLEVDRPAYGLPATLIAAIPLHTDTRFMLRELKALIDAVITDAGPDIRVAAFEFERNKIRENTLRTAMRVLRARAALPDKRLFVVGNRAKVSALHTTDETLSRRDSGIADARRNMEILTSRWLHRAYLLAENAAQGKFPSLDPLPDDPRRPSFDAHLLQRRLKEQQSWMKRELSRLKGKMNTKA